MSSRLPLYVGLTTLPSRIDFMEPVLDSLMTQTRPPDKIFLSLPVWSKRENCEYRLPDWLQNYAPHVVMVRCPEDYGPGTKLLGCVNQISEAACLVLADDDLKYRPFFLEELYKAQSAHHLSSFSYYTYPWGPVAVAQGADGFSIYTPNLTGVAEFAKKMAHEPPLRVVDDLWISAFLKWRGVKVKSLRHLIPDDKDVYETVHTVNQLRFEKGSLDRVDTMRMGLRLLMKHGYLGSYYRIKYYLAKWLKPSRLPQQS